jgi:hypothetical protein
MPRSRRLHVLLFGAAAVLLGGYETWSVFVRESPAVTIQGYHRKAAEEFGQGKRISQAFRMTASGLSAIDVQFSTDRPLTLMIRCELSEIVEPGSPREQLVSRQFVTLKRVSGVEWRRISFPSVEMSDRRWYLLRLDFIGAVPPDDSPRLSANPVPDPSARVAVIVSTDNVFGGGALWVADNRQLGSLSLRAFTVRPTAYERFRADVAPSLPRPLHHTVLDVAIAFAYHAAMLTVLYALLIRR